MKYLVATFTIETTADLMQACQDLLADGAAEAGFESFEETETGLEAYVQKDLFDKEVLDAYIADFPIEDTKITYEVKDAEDKDCKKILSFHISVLLFIFSPFFSFQTIINYQKKYSRKSPFLII